MNAPPPGEIRILIVDDNPEIVRGTEHLLKQAGYVTATAANGVEGLRSVRTFLPDLVLADRDMPEMDGLEFCRSIKSDPALAGTFVIIASAAFTGSEEQTAGLEIGADSYIARPIANRELVARVNAFVRILRLNRALREKNAELKAALAKVKLLSGLVPICAGCKKIRNDKGYWSQVEQYVEEHSEARFSHGICPACTKIYFPTLEGATPAPATN